MFLIAKEPRRSATLPLSDHFSNFLNGAGLYAQENAGNNAQNREAPKDRETAGNLVESDSYDTREFKKCYPSTTQSMEGPKDIGVSYDARLHRRDLATYLPPQLDKYNSEDRD